MPALNQLLDDVARIVKDPVSRLPVGATTRDRLSRDRGLRVDGTPGDVIDNRLGSGSDYTVFLNFLGVPVADISFEGPYGVYHSVYDTHNWVARFGDPGFRYHLALVQFLGLATMRLAGADVVPLDYEPYAQRIEDFAADAERLWMQRPGGSGAVDAMAPARKAASELRSAAARFNARRQAALQSGTDEGFLNSTASWFQSSGPCSILMGCPVALVPPPYLRPEVYLCARDASGCHGSCNRG